MIPKKIFYIWFGPILDSVVDCVKSWKNLMPDWQIIKIDEESSFFNFRKELDKCKWFNTVYNKKIWAYVSDYIRIKTLLDHGGIYCDTDITALQSFEPLRKNMFFAGFESKKYINLAVFGCIPKHILLEDIYNFYQKEIWNSPLYTIPQITTYILVEKYGIVLHDSRVDKKIIKCDSITLYPEQTFYPYRYDEEFNKRCITSKTYTIHWWRNSWGTDEVHQWLETKHCVEKINKKNNSEGSIIKYMPKEFVKLELKIIFFRIKCFKCGPYYVFELFKLPLFAIKYSKNFISYFLFSKYLIIKRQR